MFAANGSSTASVAADKTYIEDVFSAYTRTGTSASAAINVGIDIQTHGGMLHTKTRGGTYTISHQIMSSSLGIGSTFVTDTTAAARTGETQVTAVSTVGYTLGSGDNCNASVNTYVDWAWRNAPKFFKETVVTKSSGSNATVDLSTLGTVGMVKVKRTDAAGSWYVWHRSLTAGKLLIGETTAAETTLGHITVVGTTLTLVNGVIVDGTYHIEAYAHDSSADGLIQCGSFTDSNGTQSRTIGWEPQLLETKRIDSTGRWDILDTSRGFSQTEGKNLILNASDLEGTAYSGVATPTATGFQTSSPLYVNGATVIYVAVRRGPMRFPTSGAQVYQAIARTGTGGAASVSAGFPPDLVIDTDRSKASFSGTAVIDRLRGNLFRLNTAATTVESTDATDRLTAFTNDGITVGADATGLTINGSGVGYINWFFRRWPGVFDQICYTGTGSNKTEAIPLLGVPPELWLVKGRSGATQWVFGSSLLANTEKIVCPSPNGKVTDATAWNSAYPTSSALSLGTAAAVNTSTATYTALMWATLAGVSKVGAYTGDGTNGKVIPCGFAAGARFVMILRKTASAAQDIFLWDSTRGIVSGNDPHLSLNTTAAEVTTDDSIDPDASGFIVNQVAATNINVSGAEYIFLAYA
jgi:hypothetical protein